MRELGRIQTKKDVAELERQEREYWEDPLGLRRWKRGIRRWKRKTEKKKRKRWFASRR